MRAMIVMLAEEKEAITAGAKLGAVWGVLGIANWAEAAQISATFASFTAGFLSLLFVCEFLWKKIIRPACYHLGWLEQPKRRVSDLEED